MKNSYEKTKGETTMNFSNELIEKAKTASSAEELIEMAQKEGIELSAADAETYFSFLKNNGPLSAEELDQVAGGKGEDGPKPKYHAGQTVNFCGLYGVIESSYYSDFQKAFYYMCKMDNGDEMKFPLESDICPAKVVL